MRGVSITRKKIADKYNKYRGKPASKELAQSLAEDLEAVKVQIKALGPQTLTHKWRREARKELNFLRNTLAVMLSTVLIELKEVQQ
jgi:hypothetical protein